MSVRLWLRSQAHHDKAPALAALLRVGSLRKCALRSAMPCRLQDGACALHSASWEGHVEAVSALLDSGLSVGAVTKVCEEYAGPHCRGGGQIACLGTALAASQRAPARCRSLGRDKWPPNPLPQSGLTALHCAAGDGYTRTAALLL